MAPLGLPWAAYAAVLVYALGDFASGLLSDGYSFRDQAISELTAFGSPVRPLMLAAMLAHGALLLAFASGVLRATDRRSLRWTGGLLAAVALLGVPTQTIWAMSARGAETGLNDAMHIALTAAFGVLASAAVLLSAVALPGRFRALALAALAAMLLGGAGASAAMTGLAEGDTPWAGALERISAYAWFAWLLAFAATLARRAGIARGAAPFP